MSYYKRNLPHYQPEGYAFFVTARLSGTIPKQIYLQIKSEYEKKLEYISSEKNKKKKLELYKDIQLDEFLKYERILHSLKFGRSWLSNEKVAKIVADALLFYDGKEYDLFSFTIMPNHIHVIIQPVVERNSRFAPEEKSGNARQGDKYFLTNILQNFKRYTAKESNKVLNREGQFWQHESYDHVIRDKNELIKLTKYILNNPVKAGLCAAAEDWKWNYYNPEFYS